MIGRSFKLLQEHRIRRHDGAYRWFVVKASPLKDESGKVIKMYGAATDIHEQRVALEALRESEAKYRKLFNAMEEGFCSIELLYDESGQPVDHRILEANPAFAQHTGLTDVRGRLASELMPGVEQFWNDLYARVIATGESERLEQYSPAFDRWFDVDISRIGDELLRRVAVIFQDITDRKQAEAALRESEAKYRSLFQSMDQGYAVVEVLADDNGEWNDFLFLEVNPAFLAQTGMVNSVGRKATQILGTPNPQWAQIYGRVAQTGEPVRFEEKEASLERVFDLYAFRLGEAGSRRVAVLFTDISDRKRREANLSFLADIAEDFSRLSTADEIMRAVGAKVGAYLNISNCLFAEINEEQNQAIVEYTWHTPDTPDVTGVYQLCDLITKEFRQAARCGETVVISDTQTDSRVDSDRKQAEAQLSRAAQMDAFRVKLADALRSLADPVEIQKTVTRTAMNHFGTDRCYYCEIEDCNAIIRRDAAREELPTVAGVYPLSRFPILQAVIDAGHPFVVQDVYTTDTVDDDLRQLCIPMQVISYIDVPVIKDGKPVGVLCLVQSTPRNWTDLEQDLRKCHNW